MRIHISPSEAFPAFNLPLRRSLEWFEENMQSHRIEKDGVPSYILSTITDPIRPAARVPDLIVAIMGPIDCSEPACLSYETAQRDMAKVRGLGCAYSTCRPIVVELATAENFGNRNPCRDYLQQKTRRFFLEEGPLAECKGDEIVLLANGTCADWSILVQREEGESVAVTRRECEQGPAERSALFSRFVKDQLCEQRVFRGGAQYVDFPPGRNVSAAVVAAATAASGWVSCQAAGRV